MEERFVNTEEPTTSELVVGFFTLMLMGYLIYRFVNSEKFNQISKRASEFCNKVKLQFNNMFSQVETPLNVASAALYPASTVAVVSTFDRSWRSGIESLLPVPANPAQERIQRYLTHVAANLSNPALWIDSFANLIPGVAEVRMALFTLRYLGSLTNMNRQQVAQEMLIRMVSAAGVPNVVLTSSQLLLNPPPARNPYRITPSVEEIKDDEKKDKSKEDEKVKPAMKFHKD